MSFTKDELDSFNTILERKLAQHKLEIEHSFEQRISAFGQGLELRMATLQQNLQRDIPQRLMEQQNHVRSAQVQQLDLQQARMLQELLHKIEQSYTQQQQRFESALESRLAAQLLAIEQLIQQRSGPRTVEQQSEGEQQSTYDEIEVQAELSWEDLIGVISNTLGERLAVFDASIRTMARDVEQVILEQLQILRIELLQKYRENAGSGLSNTQDVQRNIEQLENIVDSLHMAMTANHTLLSNRLYHHQRLTPERAHLVANPPPVENIVSLNGEFPEPETLQAES